MKYLKLFESKRSFEELTPEDVDDMLRYSLENGGFKYYNEGRPAWCDIKIFGGGMSPNQFNGVYESPNVSEEPTWKRINTSDTRKMIVLSLEFDGLEQKRPDESDKYVLSKLKSIFNRIHNDYDCNVFLRYKIILFNLRVVNIIIQGK